MACRPRGDEQADDGTSSKIFKSLGESEAGRSFHANASTPRSKGGPPRANTSSFMKGTREGLGECEDDVRSMQAMQMRETMDRGRGQGPVRLPRGKTFRKEAASEQEGAFDDDEDEDENVPPNSSLTRRSKLVAQLELAQASSQDESAQQSNTAKHLISRFKATNTGAGLNSKDFDEDE